MVHIYTKLITWTIITETVDCGVLNDRVANAPRCSLCQNAHDSDDNINNAWCDGDCWYDDRENKCKQIGESEIRF